MPKFIVNISRELIAETAAYIEAKDLEDLKAKIELVKEYVAESQSDNDWDIQDVWGNDRNYSIDGIEEMKNPRDHVDVYLTDEIVESKEEYDEWIGVEEEDTRSKPLPGQLGIPGVGKDVT